MRKTTFAPNEYYHIYNRGVEKRTVFEHESDYHRFLALLYICNTSENIRMPKDFALHKPFDIFSTHRPKPLVDICAYCLMPNHFHLLIREKEKEGISIFMHKLATAYSKYFNAKNARTGSLFQGTFKAEHAGDDCYLKYLISYIHLNPVKLKEPKWKEEGLKERKKTQEFLEKYHYSSYQDFYGIQRPQGTIVAKGALPEYFSSPISFKENLNEWLEYNADNLWKRV